MQKRIEELLILSKIKNEKQQTLSDLIDFSQRYNDGKFKCQTESVCKQIESSSQKYILRNKKQHLEQISLNKYRFRLSPLKIGISLNPKQKISTSHKQIQQRKLLRQLIQFFDNQTKQTDNQKIFNMANRIFPKSINKINTSQQGSHSSYRFSQMKAKIRSSQNKAEGHSSHEIIKKGRSMSLKKSLKIENALIQKANRHPLLKRRLFFKQRSALNKQQMRQLVKEQILIKLPALGGWDTDNLQTNYLI